MTTSTLQLNNLSKAFFGVYAVKNVSLAVEAGSILGLIGENGAGKSTLMNIVGGVVKPDEGSMWLAGQPYAPRTPRDAQKAGIAFIHQELNLFTNLTIGENIFLDNFPRRGIFPFISIDRAEIRRRTADLLAQVDLKSPSDMLIERLSPGERQLVEIAKALQLDARLIIFDEPTTSLTARETDKLFAIINRLREANKAIIYISHILNDVLRLVDHIAVMRDGEMVSNAPKAEYDTHRMISLMIGRTLEKLYPARTATPSAEPILAVCGLSEPGIVNNITFTIHKGEVVGLFGLMGSGRTELARILFGVDSFERGQIKINEVLIERNSPRAAIRHHVAFVTENRREEGLLMGSAIADNIALVSLSTFASRLTQVIDQQQLSDAARHSANVLQIKATSIEQQAAKSLSGGNQQKVVLAKWLLSHPSLFILDEPTRGIDVGAKYEIYSIVGDLAAQGCGVMMISSELEELIGVCDRILVMSKGELCGEFHREDFNKSDILRAAFREGSNDGAHHD